jgi:hypothetical protein
LTGFDRCVGGRRRLVRLEDRLDARLDEAERLDLDGDIAGVGLGFNMRDRRLRHDGLGKLVGRFDSFVCGAGSFFARISDFFDRLTRYFSSLGYFFSEGFSEGFSAGRSARPAPR